MRTYLVGVPHNPRLAQVIRHIPDEDYTACIDEKEGEVAEFGYRMAHDDTFRRYVVKRIAISPGEQAELETAGYHYWVPPVPLHTDEISGRSCWSET